MMSVRSSDFFSPSHFQTIPLQFFEDDLGQIE